MSTIEFTALGLRAELAQTVADLGYETPTPIQSAVIPAMLSGRDVIGQAQTGTGKTAAFALPILHNLDDDRREVQCLVLAPTRELAMQVADAMYQYGAGIGVRVLPVFGGQPYGRQISRLRKGVDVVVGTPGRLLDLIRQGALDLSAVSTLVLDEADEMLSMGFIEDIESILSETPAVRQTALFSATMPAEIRRLADRYMRNPQSCTIERKQMTVAALEQRYYVVNERDKLAALTRLFEVEPITSALVFARTRVGTGDLANELTVRGFQAEALNGDMSQDARLRVLDRFKNDRIKVLVATDVAARGLDIDDISHVINFDLPMDPEIYVHRVGRTGRAGKTGVALTLLSPKEQWRLRKIEQYTRQKIEAATLPTVEAIHAHRQGELLEQVNVWLKRGRCNREREMVAALMEAGHDPVDVAAVALKLARAEEKQRPIAEIAEVREERPRREYQKVYGRENGRSNGNGRSYGNGRAYDNVRAGESGRGRRNGSHEAGMVRMTLDMGKMDGVRVNDVVRSIAHYSGIPGKTLGKIRVQDEHTFVDVPERFAGQVLAETGNYRIGTRIVSVEVA